MILPMRRCFFVPEMCHQNGMIYMTIKVMELMESRLERCFRKMSFKSLLKDQRIHNGGVILLMSSITSKSDCQEEISKCFSESGKAKLRIRTSS
jgi:hypothetical protein